MVLYSAFLNDIPNEFAISMYHLNIISNDSYNTFKALKILDNRQKANFLTNLLMQSFRNPTKYDTFKISLKEMYSFQKLSHQIDFIG